MMELIIVLCINTTKLLKIGSVSRAEKFSNEKHDVRDR